MNGIIYEAIFPNNKRYIGQTIQEFKKRITRHKSTYNVLMKKVERKEITMNDVFPFYRAIHKYGWDNIVWGIIEENIENRDQLNIRERYWIRELCTYIGFKKPQGYNANLGGGAQDRFTSLNEDKLKEYGEDYRQGMSIKELQNKYQLSWAENKDYYSGYRLSEYTGIKEDITVKFSVNFTQPMLKDMIEDFKINGSCRKIADKYNCDIRTIEKIMHGEIFSEYTGIYNREFYTEYRRISQVVTREQVQEIIELDKEGYTIDQLCEKFNCTRHFISDIFGGRVLQEYSGIKPGERKRKAPKTHKGGKKLSQEDVLWIIQESDRGVSAKEIATTLEVTKECIYRIVLGQSRSNITGRKYNKETKTYNIIDIKKA